jgi:ankyrin repeat protein
LLKHGADINLRSSDGRTPLMWAAFRNNVKMAEFLMDNGADVTAEDNQGWSALDIAIIKMNYEVALLLKRRGLKVRDRDIYEKNLWQKYDIDMFLEYLEEEREQVEYKRFFDLIKSKLHYLYISSNQNSSIE